MNNQLTEKIESEVRGLDATLHGVVAKVDGAIDAGKDRLAAGMERGAEQLLAGAVAIENRVMQTAGSLGDGAQALRDVKPSELLADARSLVKKYPVQSMVAGLVAGLLVGRSIWSRRSSQVKADRS